MSEDAPDQAPDPRANWSPRRRAWEAEMEAHTKRALELLATLEGRPVEVQGLQLRKRPRTPAELYWRKKALWRERRR